MELSSGDGGEGVTEHWLLDTQVSAVATESRQVGFPGWGLLGSHPGVPFSNAISICPPLVLPSGLRPSL